ncbi:MAG: (2Fe-2S)-binding protein [Hyphomicrobium aestuarii]|nr:(2Fe-2S)-binding protein [Hyphomicrobium aestuarii]
MPQINVNGKTVDVDADPATPLLWAIREQLGLTGTKYGCGVAACGACTVHIDGAAVRSCSLTLAAVKPGQKIVTIEGLSADGSHPVQKAWAALDVPQCGYCQTGMIMTAAALLATKPKPTDADIDAEMSNICRCGTHVRVRAAIHAASGNGTPKTQG